MNLARLIPDHTILRAALTRAQEALAELDQLQADGPPPAPKKGEERQRHYFLGTVRQAWDEFHTQLTDHMAHEELVLPALVERMERGEADGAEVLATLRPLADHHERIHEAAARLRRAVMSIEPVRRPLDGAVAAFLRHAEEEDLQTFPQLARHMGLDYTAPSAGRYSNDAKLSRILRANLRPQPPAPPPRGPSLLQRLVKALGEGSRRLAPRMS